MVMADTGMAERVDLQKGCRVRALACGTGIRYRFVSLLRRRTFHTKQTHSPGPMTVARASLTAADPDSRIFSGCNA